MSTPLAVEFAVRFGRAGHGRKVLEAKPAAGTPDLPPGRVPRVARLLALALKFERLVRDGVVKDYAELARLGQVTRARMSQVMGLLHLAPDVMEEVLFLPLVEQGREQICSAS
jgi:hypothetical protein